MTVSRADRRREREPLVRALFGGETDRALDLLEVVELAWHDCYDEITPPDDIIDDMLTLSQGTLAGLIEAARLAVCDWRDLKMALSSGSRQAPNDDHSIAMPPKAP